MIIRSIAVFICLFLVSCAPAGEAVLYRGAGLDLDAARAGASVRNLRSYLDAMCASAGLSGSASVCPERLDHHDYRVLLEAGMGEISLGCRSYVQFVFEQRQRDEQFRTSSSAVQSFVGGVLKLEGAGTNLFSYLILGSAAANAFYDISRIDPLRGMTPDNILRVVTERQRAFEVALAGRTISSAPQLFRIWHEYQWLCSPLSISSDFNALAVAGIEGRKVDFSSDARTLADSITGTIETIKRYDENKAIAKTPTSEPLPNALGPNEADLHIADVKKIQAALCLKSTGILDESTRVEINNWRSIVTPGFKKEMLQSGLTREEIDYLRREGSCRDLGYASVYERALYYDSASFGENLTTQAIAAARAAKFEDLAKYLGVQYPKGSIRFTEEIRLAIRAKQKEFKLNQSGIVDAQFYENIR